MTISIEMIGLPKEIKERLAIISASVDIVNENRKGGSGHLFFGKNKVSLVPVAIKFFTASS